MSQLEMFTLNIRFLIGLLVCLGILAVLVIALWTGVKVGFFHWRRKQGQEEEHRRKFRPDGRPWPPSSAGICGRCGGVFDKVFHLPDGSRLCPTCYDPSIEA